MQIPKLRVLSEAGAVRAVTATYETAANGWEVQVCYATRSGERREALERQRGGVRGFATLDAVASCLFAAGCEAFQVVTPRSGAG